MGGERRPRACLTMVLLTVLLLLSGCWDRAEIEDQSYVIALGIDHGDRGDLVLTMMVALVQELSAGALETPVRPGETRLAARYLTARAKTIQHGLYILAGGMTRRLDFRHLRAIVVGEEMARQGIEALAMEQVRSTLGRGSALFMVARPSAFAVLTAIEPVGEINPSRLAEGWIMQSKNLHMGPPVRFQHFTARLAMIGIDPVMPVLAINPEVTVAPQHPAPPPQDSALPGQLPRGGGNPVELVGTAIFRHDRLAGFLTVDETQVLLALRGEMGKAYVTFPDPDAPAESVHMRFHQENIPKYTATLRGNRPHVQVRVLLESELLAAPGGTDYTREDARERLNRAATKYTEGKARELLAKLKEWGADPVGFGMLYRGRFRSYPEWVGFDWHRRVSDLHVDVTAQMRLRRYGLLTGPDRIPER